MPEGLSPQEESEAKQHKGEVYMWDGAVRAYDENINPAQVANDKMRAEHGRDAALDAAEDHVDERLDKYIETARQDAEAEDHHIDPNTSTEKE